MADNRKGKDMRLGDRVTIRLKEGHRRAIEKATDENGPYGFRSYTEFVQHLIERWEHDRTDKITRRQRDAMFERIYENTERLVALFSMEDVPDFGPGQNTLRAIKNHLQRLGFTPEDFSSADDETG